MKRARSKETNRAWLGWQRWSGVQGRAGCQCSLRRPHQKGGYQGEEKVTWMPLGRGIVAEGRARALSKVGSMLIGLRVHPGGQ